MQPDFGGQNCLQALIRVLYRPRTVIYLSLSQGLLFHCQRFSHFTCDSCLSKPTSNYDEDRVIPIEICVIQTLFFFFCFFSKGATSYRNLPNYQIDTVVPIIFASLLNCMRGQNQNCLLEIRLNDHDLDREDCP